MMQMTPPEFVLDTNIFVQANLGYYAPDICPSFWQALLEAYLNGRLVSIDKVREEILVIDDNLAVWAKAEASALFVSSDLQPVSDAFTEMVAWVQQNQQFTEAAKAEFLDAADGWVAAYASVHNATVVTLETYDANIKRKVKLPNVCRQFGVECINTFEMLRRLGVQF